MGKKLRVYLGKSIREAAKAGKHNFLRRLENAVERRGLTVEFCANNDHNLQKSRTRKGYSLFHMDDPHHENALTMRRVYFQPFWQIENSAARWEWAVAKAEFDPKTIDSDKAWDFTYQWRNKWFGDWTKAKNQGYIYMPLQGRLQEKRSFQSCSPIDMIRQTLKYGPKKPVIATLHPGEDYSAHDFELLSELVDDYPRFAVHENKSPADLLPECECVVTQNSAIAFSGYFWRKPAVLFGQIDFHHIALNVGELGAEEAFKRLPSHRPAYEEYIYWFLQIMSINAGRPETEDKIIETLQLRGWDL
ncbi:MAG: hypothetical protein ACPGUX_00300 [Halocynthiibacter sp.]